MNWPQEQIKLTIDQRNTLATIMGLIRGKYGVTAYELGKKLGLSETAAAGRLRTLRDKRLIEYGGESRYPTDAAPHRLTRLGRDVFLTPGDYLITGPADKTNSTQEKEESS